MLNKYSVTENVISLKSVWKTVVLTNWYYMLQITTLGIIRVWLNYVILAQLKASSSELMRSHIAVAAVVAVNVLELIL